MGNCAWMPAVRCLRNTLAVKRRQRRAGPSTAGGSRTTQPQPRRTASATIAVALKHHKRYNHEELTSRSSFHSALSLLIAMLVTVTVLVPLPLAYAVASVSCGASHSCALMAAGDGVRCWGSNSFGQLGDGTAASRSTMPSSNIAGLTAVTAICAGYDYSCALVSTNSGTMFCWGDNTCVSRRYCDVCVSVYIASCRHDRSPSSHSAVMGNNYGVSIVRYCTVIVWVLRKNNAQQLGYPTGQIRSRKRPYFRALACRTRPLSC